MRIADCFEGVGQDSPHLAARKGEMLQFATAGRV